MTDRAAKMAELIISLAGHSGEVVHGKLLERYPDMTEDEFGRSFGIAFEVLTADAAEYEAEAKAIHAELARRKRERRS